MKLADVFMKKMKRKLKQKYISRSTKDPFVQFAPRLKFGSKTLFRERFFIEKLEQMGSR